MPSYTLLWKGDRLPTVGVLQCLINRAGASLEVDGVFGPKTDLALIEFKRARGMPLDGIADKETWQRLLFHDKLTPIDVIDVFDPGMLLKDAKFIEETGGSPILMGGMSNGLAQMATDLSTSRVTFLLRFGGHGRPGVQGVSLGEGYWSSQRHGKPISHSFPHRTTSMSSANARELRLGTIQSIFGPYASVELHGCKVARGAKGHRFIRTLANLLRVPVSAAMNYQRSPIRFDGPTFTACPHGISLAQWCANLPPFTPITVP